MAQWALDEKMIENEAREDVPVPVPSRVPEENAVRNIPLT